jgi:mannosyltransferase OCH1-like enzyme
MDLSKFLMLYRYGETVLDTDVVILKSLESLSNTAGFHVGYVNNNVMTFSKKHRVMRLALEIFPKRYAKSLASELHPQLCAQTLLTPSFLP